VWLGVDLGGSKIEAVALGADGNESIRLRVAAPQGDYQAAVTAVAGRIARVEAETGPADGVGIGTPVEASCDLSPARARRLALSPPR
jgi:fructokinase